MPNAVASRAKSLATGSVQGQSLRVVPILGASSDQPAYEMLRPETVEFVKVTEVSSAGTVPVLLVDNSLDVSVYLMDGQELLGAKQNRILNTDVLVPAKQKLPIPVSCVERGRWRSVSHFFRPGKSSHRTMRRDKLERVKRSLRAGQGHDADQRAVWAEVSHCLGSLDVSSPTEALNEAYERKEKELTGFRSKLQMPAEAVGLAVFMRSEFLGLDVFDRHSTLKYFWDSLVDSYAVDFLASPVDPASPGSEPEGELIRQHLDRAAEGRWEEFPSPGEGVDWRLDDEKLSGAALVWDSSVVIHLQLFPKVPSRDDFRTAFSQMRGRAGGARPRPNEPERGNE
jgi:hypothetical protein